ncbi:hypothetical protein BBK82_07175 [Lentzea guizhouensis]|uniref:Uncharacterized protein n=1 Tax=Lentzea guizhouensis TaxID=1586287 RepID=A0A1B2HDU7_9PSEU|nr:hypothetical protein BBK82_07175 [Lentzea guizhouensis]
MLAGTDQHRTGGIDAVDVEKLLVIDDPRRDRDIRQRADVRHRFRTRWQKHALASRVQSRILGRSHRCGAVTGRCGQHVLGDQYLFRVSAGASLGVVIALTMGSALMVGLGVTGAAFAGPLLSLATVFLMAQRARRQQPRARRGRDRHAWNAATSYLQLQATRPRCGA